MEGDIDRLRLEFTASCSQLDTIFPRSKTLNDFIDNPKLGKYFSNKFAFFNAKKSSKHLPQEHERYRSFQEEFMKARVINGDTVYQQREKSTCFSSIEKYLKDVTEWFDLSWNNPDIPKPSWNRDY